MAEPSQRRLKVALAGLDAQSAPVVRTMMEKAPYLELVAVADSNPAALDSFRQRYSARTYDSVEKLCQDPDVEVIWVSTPNTDHCRHTIMAAQAGKHVVVEKPMAVTLDEAQRMVEAAEKHSIKLMCGHTANLMAANRAMRKVVASGELGKIGAVNIWSYTDWMFRLRTPDEMDLSKGGGPIYRQGPHQVDIIRLLGGGMVRSVRAQMGQWFAARPAPGYYAAFIEFEDGTPATVVHNGYSYFNSFEFVPWAGSTRFREEGALRRKALRADPSAAEEQAVAKDQTRVGGAREEEASAQRRSPAATFQGDLGIVITSCERGDVRQSPDGLWIYDDDGQREVAVEGIHDERLAELNEIYEAVTQDRPVLHDGRWGLATLEVVLAIMQSARERTELYMQHQCPSYE